MSICTTFITLILRGSTSPAFHVGSGGGGAKWDYSQTPQLFLHLCPYSPLQNLSLAECVAGDSVFILHQYGPKLIGGLSSHEVSHLDSLHVLFLHLFLPFLHFFLHCLSLHALLHVWKDVEHSPLHSSRLWHDGGDGLGGGGEGLSGGGDGDGGDGLGGGGEGLGGGGDGDGGEGLGGGGDGDSGEGLGGGGDGGEGLGGGGDGDGGEGDGGGGLDDGDDGDGGGLGDRGGGLGDRGGGEGDAGGGLGDGGGGDGDGEGQVPSTQLEP